MRIKSKLSLAGVILRVMVAAALLSGAVFFLVDCKLENLVIQPGSVYSAEEIEDRLFTVGTDRYAALFAARINYLWNEDIPFVEKIDVELVDRNSVIVYVYDKAVIGCVEHMGSYVYFDREGMAVDSADSIRTGIPLITGLTFNKIAMGEQLDLSDGEAFGTILDILMLLEKNELVASDIDFGLRRDITIHIGDDEFLLGISDNYDMKINNIPGALGAVSEGSFVFDLRNYDNDNLEIDVRRLQ